MTWKRVLLVALAVVGLFLLVTAALFSGSLVACDESATATGPALHCDFFVGAPLNDVWSAFTRTGAPRPYYFDAVLEAEMRPGGRWRFVTENRERLLAGGEIVTIDPPHRFEQSFSAADLDDAPSRIVVELEAVSDGTRVLLVHDGFPSTTRTFRRFRRAHPLALSALKSVLETGELPLRAQIYTAIFKPGMRFATVRAEPWD